MDNSKGRIGTGVSILRMAGYEELSIDNLNEVSPKIAPEMLQILDRFERMHLRTSIGMAAVNGSVPSLGMATWQVQRQDG
jgi:hypothetical protein